MCTAAQGTSSVARARSMIHGVCPPLTARVKRPREATASRALAAIVTAPACATDSASFNTSNLIGFLQTESSATNVSQIKTKNRVRIHVAASSGSLRCDAKIFSVRRGWIIPASRGQKRLVDFTGAPTPLFIFIDRSAAPQDRINDSPSFLHVVLTREQSGVACHGVAQDSLVRIHFVGTRVSAGHHFHGLAL